MTETSPDEAVAHEWEDVAGWWQRNFSQGADPEYEEQILPLIAEHVGDARRVLEVGTGEGQVARTLAAGGAGRRAVVGVDAARNQLVAAVERAGGPVYARAVAERLPIAD